MEQAGFYSSRCKRGGGRGRVVKEAARYILDCLKSIWL